MDLKSITTETWKLPFTFEAIRDFFGDQSKYRVSKALFSEKDPRRWTSNTGGLIFCTQGQIRYKFEDGQEIVLKAGQLYFLEKGNILRVIEEVPSREVKVLDVRHFTETLNSAK